MRTPPAALHEAEAGETVIQTTTPPNRPLRTAERDEEHNAAPDSAGSHITIKCEDVAATLRPAPQPSVKRRESEAADAAGAEPSDGKASKKRKRAASPPWQFPTAENTTLHAADGRRISARVNTATPVLSENDNSRPTSTSRAPSPPWKKFRADGPTAVTVDGVRKSGRVNKELSDAPTRTSPRQKQRVEKTVASEQNGGARAVSGGQMAASEAVNERPTSKGVNEWPTSKGAREMLQPSSSEDRIRQLRAQIDALRPTRTFRPPSTAPLAMERIHKPKHSTDVLSQLDGPASPTRERRMSRPSSSALSPQIARPSPRIKLRFSAARHHINPPHPSAQPPSPGSKPPRLSLHQVIEEYDLKELQQPYSENERGPPSREHFITRNAKQAEEEGVMRRKLLEAAHPGGPLSKEHCSIYQEEQQPEPAPQYARHDHLVAHALYLRHLQIREKTQHRQLAKKLACEALEKWREKRGPTEEDVQAEADKMFRLVYKQVVVDVKMRWELVERYVMDIKRQRYEAEQEAKRQERLQKQLEWSEHMVARQRGQAEGSVADSDFDVDEFGSDDEEVGEDSNNDEEADSEVMSESGSEGGEEKDESDEEEGEMDEDALAAYLAQRQVDPPDKPAEAQPSELQEMLGANAPGRDGDGDGARDRADPNIITADVDPKPQPRAEHQTIEHSGSNAQPTGQTAQNEDSALNDTHIQAEGQSSTRRSRASESNLPTQEEQDAQAAFSSDESTDMDSEDYDSDEDMSDSDKDSDDGEGEASDASEKPATSSGLWALFSNDEKKAMGLPTPVTSAEDDNDRDDRAEGQATPRPEATVDAQAEPGARHSSEEIMYGSRADVKIPSIDVVRFDQIGEPAATKTRPEPLIQESRLGTPSSLAPSSPVGKQMVPQPTLLRGTLRSYQHAGLDWLASLNRNGTNGILADEMGLGKTIQTIALLAHLAEEKKVWETHLVIVPTSVILNWVTEFQKFLPGFRVLGYYGSSEERQIKRRGWVNDPHHENKEKRGYNAVVTSYNVALKDINAIRNVQWHYLVLDEAHNIRNFNSQRFQVLIRLRSRARLLLTGTPLQNSLTELWSLLTFLTARDDNPQHGSLEEFLSHWKEPVKEIFDRGFQTLSEEASKVVGQLHTSLRPFMLRRLKSEVEKDLPKKTEHTVVCKLSKRQRQLYQDYMGLAHTRERLTHGNAVTAGKVLLSLRRVCNHPDLFDPRPIQTSFAMELSPLEPYAVKERLIRGLLGVKESAPPGLVVAANESRGKYAVKRSRQLSGIHQLQRELDVLERVPPASNPDLSIIGGCRAYQRMRQRQQKLQHLRDGIAHSEVSLSSNPVYGSDLRRLLTVRSTRASANCAVTGRMRIITRDITGTQVLLAKPEFIFDASLSQKSLVQQALPSLDQHAERLRNTIIRFAFCTPEVTAPNLNLTFPPHTQQRLRAAVAYASEVDYAHEARIRTSIVFPDSRLLVYDSGKLQRLTSLLRELQGKGSRSLIFTQMTGTLNILEQFLNLLNLPYLRLDGSTSVERRQLYSAEFNRPDSKYQCMILSSRAGGVGLNLTGASSVIFYDLDWNPQMDKQCMDRAHRIGQVRDVEVYKMVSEKTVEENILRRANQKSLLDQTVIQEGHFTTDYQRDGRDSDKKDVDDVGAAIDRFLAGGDKAITKTIESVEDKEDVEAAQQARKEEQQDDEEFAERSSKGASFAATSGSILDLEHEMKDEEDRQGHMDIYMIAQMERLLEEVPYVPSVVRRADRHGRDPSHRPKRKR